jgi:predicted nucleotidyltransferase
VHADFRPGSDIDVMVRRRPGVQRTLADELDLRRALEDLLGRDVDLVDAALLREQVRERAQSEGVVLYG